MNNVNVFFETNFETDLKNELTKKNYKNCIDMLNEEIKDFYVNKIKKYYIINRRNYSTSCELYTLLNIYNELEKIS